MKELYRRILSLDPEKEHELATVTGGIHAGTHVLSTRGQVVWCSDPELAALPGDVKTEDLFRERLTHPLRLFVCGCGFVGQAVIRLAAFLGWETCAIDDREEFTQAAREAGAHRVICSPFGAALSQISADEGTCFVIVTREHKYDRECLEVILRHPFGYAGMMGSHHRAAMMRQSLQEEGICKEKIEQIHTPVGLAIHAQTPEEIAVSIVAQIIQEKENFAGGSAFSRELETAIRTLCVSDGQAMLAVITSRKGSTPRKPGARMLIYPDGSTVGTIGGGLMEAEVIRRAVGYLAQPSGFQPCSITIDLTGKTDQYADMACGGVTQVFLEMLA
ncbi:MAG TPA: xanthine dehydrogenase [Lachnospiraceae bacterium]|nr:xanthine dehydrogenase [Lachnospiraceae bacterium]